MTGTNICANFGGKWDSPPWKKISVGVGNRIKMAEVRNRRKGKRRGWQY